MRFIKIGGLIAIALVALLVVIGMLAPDPKKQGGEASTETKAAVGQATTQAKAVNVKAPERPADQCLDGVCIGATPSELLSLNWREKEVTSDSALNSTQRELLDSEEKALLEKCVLRQQSTWAGRSEKVCLTLVRGASNFIPYEYRPLQMRDVLKVFSSSDLPATCSVISEPLRIVGHVQTGSGLTKVELRANAQGQFRVYSIEKPYVDDNAETMAAITQKLKEKHPYIMETARSRSADAEFSGSAPWGGNVTLNQRSGSAPVITMLGAKSDFDSTQISACNAAKTVNVQ